MVVWSIYESINLLYHTIDRFTNVLQQFAIDVFTDVHTIIILVIFVHIIRYFCIKIWLFEVLYIPLIMNPWKCKNDTY